ncbi:MAG TPA: hypothetical protein PKY82_07450 [Pyrinomonadaceae bacterium]|nr:hypothetical protein [Pyrinomonadaceae bacterium]
MKKAIILTTVLFAVIFITSQNSFAQQGPCLLGVNCPPTGGNTASSTADIYFNSNGSYYGRVTAYNGVFYKIDTAGGTTIKTFKDSCRANDSNGVAGYVCTFAQFNNSGQHIYSGYGVFYQNGVVYLKWTNENVAGIWREIQTDWFAFRPTK